MNRCHTNYPTNAKTGDLALCARGILGVVTGKKGDTYVGYRVYDPRGSRWSSKKPRVVGRIGDVNGFVATLKEQS
jgi:hypothetical protein